MDIQMMQILGTLMVSVVFFPLLIIPVIGWIIYLVLVIGTWKVIPSIAEKKQNK